MTSNEQSKINRQLIMALSLVLDYEGETKLYHAWRTALLAAKLSDTLLPQMRQQLFYGGLLHDIGSVGLPDHLVHYTLEYQPQDTSVIEQIQMHSVIGEGIVRSLPGLELAAQAIANHHENYNGSGYPQGLKENKIPFTAQILRCADEMDLLLRKELSFKQYREQVKAWNNTLVCQEIAQAALFIVNPEFWQQISDLDWVSEKVPTMVRDEAMPALNLEGSTPIFLKVFARVIDAKHKYTKGHSERVASYAHSIAQEMALSEEECQWVYWAGLLHDVGKLAVPKAVLDKKERLTRDELSLIKQHPQITIDFLKMIDDVSFLAEWAGLHHERIDGKGYPYGLQGEDIPLIARVISVADAFDAITSQRSYQLQRTVEQALDILSKVSGSQLDETIVNNAVRVLASAAKNVACSTEPRHHY